MKRVWKERPQHSKDLLTQLLRGRGVVSDEAAEEFLHPQYERSHDPFLLSGMREAAVRVQAAIAKNEKITIYADYDADAVTAAAVLLRYFQKIGYANAGFYIPDRNSEGYGMNTDAVKLLADQGTKLIITVDCGINAFDAIDLATYLGMDVVVTDHHQLTAGVPRAAAVVNPHKPDDVYPFKDLTGVGVAFKLVQALQATSSTPPAAFEKWLLDLVAIGTVADCQSLLGENRIFVKWGLHVLQKTRWLGLRKLMELAEIADESLDTYHIGFIIAPRINAAGRMEHASRALELLLTDDPAAAEIMAQKLDELNRHRQQVTETVLSEAREQLAARSEQKILLAAAEGWPRGIVGLVAGKLTEEFYRPVLVLEKGVEEATGSARSIGGFNIVEAIGHSKEILTRYGGHAQAAGFTLQSTNIELFYKNLLQYAETVLTDEDLSPVLHYESEITLADVKAELLDVLGDFAPFGLGNPRPRFRINNIEPRFPTAIGKEGKHLRFYAGDFSCIAFNMGYWANKITPGSKIDVICEPQYNDWNGQRKIQLRIIDLQVSA